MHFVLILFTTYTPGTIRLKKKVRTISKNCDNDNFIDRSLIGDTVSYKELMFDLCIEDRKRTIKSPILIRLHLIQTHFLLTLALKRRFQMIQ